jgi:hypothetical protein
MSNETVLLLVLASLVGGFTGGVLVGKLVRVPFISYRLRWSIGIYTGQSPFDLASPEKLNPVLTGKDVTDVRARSVADPFMIAEGSVWYMFFEVLNADTNRGAIGLAASSDGLKWKYERIVLEEPFHLSYPYVFKWNDAYYMVPESREGHSVRLYKAEHFPIKWLLGATLLHGDFVDPSVVNYRGKWWIFVGYAEGNNVLRLYYADALEGPYAEHSKSPIVLGDARIARPAGRILILGDRIYRFAQDDHLTYGNQVKMFEITDLTPTCYAEREVEPGPVLRASGSGWNAEGMHHVDLHQTADNKWVASVDGRKRTLCFELRKSDGVSRRFMGYPRSEEMISSDL